MLMCNCGNSINIVEQAKKDGMNEDKIYYFENKKEILETLEKIAKPGDIILFKASNGMKFYELAEEMVKKSE